MFRWMPLAARIDGTILCMHGGIPRELYSPEQLHGIARPLFPKSEGDAMQRLAFDLLWSAHCCHRAIVVAISPHFRIRHRAMAQHGHSQQGTTTHRHAQWLRKGVMHHHSFLLLLLPLPPYPLPLRPIAPRSDPAERETNPENPPMFDPNAIRQNGSSEWAGYIFNTSSALAFMRNNGLRLIIRGHEPVYVCRLPCPALFQEWHGTMDWPLGCAISPCMAPLGRRAAGVRAHRALWLRVAPSVFPLRREYRGG